MALARRARETSDPAFYAKAEEALGRALAKTPDDYEALRARVWILLGQHHFAEARDEAQRPAEARARRHRWSTASSATRTWSSATTPRPRRRCSGCSNLRPGNVPGLTRGAYLRETDRRARGRARVHGRGVRAHAGRRERGPRLDPDPDRAPPALVRRRGRRGVGRPAGARRCSPTITTRSRSSPACAPRRAATRRRWRSSPSATSRRRIRRTCTTSAARSSAPGGRREAQAAFALFEQKAVAESESPDNCNRELIAYYVAHGRAGRRAPPGRARGRAPARRAHARRVRLGAAGERARGGRAHGDRGGARGRRQGRAPAVPRGRHRGARGRPRRPRGSTWTRPLRVNATSEVAADVARLRKRIG